MEKRFTLLLIVLVVLTKSSFAEIIASGNDCGSNCSWTISDDGVLDIQGSGDMNSYHPPENPQPWFDYKNDIKTINVGQGIKSIGNYDFVLLDKVTSVSLPDGLEHIYGGAFEQMFKLKDINIPDSVQSIGGYVFSWSSEVRNLVIPDSVTFLDYNAFVNTSSQTNIYCSTEKKQICEKVLEYVGKDKSLLRVYEKIGNQYFYDNKFFASLSNIADKNYTRKRIYTIDEAERVSKKTGNKFMIKYR